MPECTYCTQQFDDEQRLRRHLFWDHERDTLGRIDRKRVERFLADAESQGTVPADVDRFRSFLSDPDAELLLDALREYNTWLERTRSYEGREACQDLFWSYYAPIVDKCDAVVRREGWSELAAVIDEFHPRRGQQWPLVSPVIANLTGRFVIRTRSSESVDAIPDAALSYLGDTPRYTGPMDAEVHAEGEVYGWGIGHDSHAVADRIYEVATEDIRWAHSALFEAFWADQSGAVSLLERLTTSPEVPRPRFFVGCVGLVDSYARTPETSPSTHPRYWQDSTQFRGEFAWERATGTRIRELVSTLASESDASTDWPDTDSDWTFDDLRL